jgi:hypothetical protein
VRISKLKYPAYPNCRATARYLKISSDAFAGTYVTYRQPKFLGSLIYLCQWRLKGDGGGFEVFYVFTYAKSFTNDAEIDFSGIVGCDGRRWIRLAVKVPAVSLI